MNWAVIDIIYGILMLLCALVGLKQGFLRGIMETLGVGISFLAAALFHEILTLQLDKLWGQYGWNFALAFLIIFILVLILLQWLRRLLQKILRAASLEEADRVLGFFLGLAVGVVLCFVVTYILGTQDLISTEGIMKNSRLAPIFIKGMPYMVENLQTSFRQLFEGT